MKLIDALREIGSDSNKFTVNKINTEILGIRYRKKKDDMINCNRTTGEYVEDPPLLFWNYRMLDSDGWEIKTVVKPKYKIGDRFLFNHLYTKKTKTDQTYPIVKCENVIVEIITWVSDANGNVIYTLSTGGIALLLILTEEYLEELDMVVYQE